jgi:hypothetical protein
MAHGRQAEISPRDDTDELRFGRALHSALLEPDRFDEEFAVAPYTDRRTKAGKNTWTEFSNANSGKTIITADEYECTEKMQRVAYDHPVVSLLLSEAAATELSIVWKDADTELLCKGRIDLLTTFCGWTIIGDIKTTVDASRHAFKRQATAYGYYRAMAWYRRGLNELVPAERRCVLVAIEKTPPFCVVPYELDEMALKIGDAENVELLARYAECKRSGLWPGYSDNIVVMDLPAWKVKGYEQGSGAAD